MTWTLWLSIAITITGATGMYLSGRNKWYGWLIGLLAQPIWFAFGIVTHGYGLIGSCFLYGTVYWINLRRWYRHRNVLEVPR